MSAGASRRISTNVRNADGTRAIGTRVSKEVNTAVLREGKPWNDRAFVVNDWYITAYEPIRSIRDEIIGILYVGTLEKPYLDIANQVMATFILIAALCVVFLSRDTPQVASTTLAEGLLTLGAMLGLRALADPPARAWAVGSGAAYGLSVIAYQWPLYSCQSDAVDTWVPSTMSTFKPLAVIM